MKFQFAAQTEFLVKLVVDHRDPGSGDSEQHVWTSAGKPRHAKATLFRNEKCEGCSVISNFPTKGG
eukprot:2864552-Rhodomonas_salina.1